MSESRHLRAALCAAGACVLLLSQAGWTMHSSAAAAVSGGPAWAIRSFAQPTYFSSASNTACAAAPTSGACDTYRVVVTNVGGEATLQGGRIAIADDLPAGIEAVRISGEDLGSSNGSGAPLTCDVVSVQCTYEPSVAPGDTLVVTVDVTITGGIPENEKIVSHASISGGGASAAATDQATTVSVARVPFGIADFSIEPFDAGGSSSSQAGAHPYDLLSSFDLNTTNSDGYTTPEGVRDVVVNLPLGLVGNPLAAQRCPLHKLLLGTGETLCPAASQVGVVSFEKEPGQFNATVQSDTATSALYNMEPERGYPAEFGFTYLNKPVIIYGNLGRVGGRYVLRVVSPGIPAIGAIETSLLFFGDPAERDGGDVTRRPFFTNPTVCTTGPLTASISADSWQRPSVYTPPLESTVYPQITGCDMLTFQPTLKFTPDTTQADEPAGYTFDVTVPQSEEPETPATPELKNATVTLPPGVSISPSAADGLRACQETGPEGINIEGPEATEMGVGGSPYHDGQEHLSPGHCPAASTVGNVEVTTPVLPDPLQGHLFVAAPKCGGAGQPACSEADATNGNLFGVYLEASGAGAIVKLHGTVSANPVTGQLTTTFSENPQLPFGDLTLSFKSGPRAPLANPQSCGPATTFGDMVPWSTPATPDANPFNSFLVDWDGNGGTCPASAPLAPSFLAGTISPAAGGFSPFTLTLSRGDREQDLSQIAVHMPPGLLGVLSGITRCQEPQAQAGTCPAASQIGTTAAAAGAGPHPFWITGGRVYLTGPYRGSPFGLSIVVPAVAGPFNLGNVVVRSAISVDQSTTALTVTSDPLPQIIDGVPLRLRTVTVTVDRPGFIFNPTNCATKHITGTVAGAQGALAAVSSPFTAIGCAGLPFKTKFSASTQARTSKKEGASLDVKFTDAPGQANIAKVAVSLPKKLPSRLTTIQHACPASVFAENPAACSPISLIGVARASTPVLPQPVTGPAYLVSHGGAAFPDLVIVFQGEGVRFDQVGSINISKSGITSSTFASVPDVPVSSFELRFPKGRASALTTAYISAAAKGDICGQKLVMPTTITAQNGAQIKQNTKIAITGCPKVKKARKASGGGDAVASAGQRRAGR